MWVSAGNFWISIKLIKLYWEINAFCPKVGLLVSSHMKSHAGSRHKFARWLLFVSTSYLSAPLTLLGFLIKEIKQHLSFWIRLFCGNLVGFAASWWVSFLWSPDFAFNYSCPVKALLHLLQKSDLFLPHLQTSIIVYLFEYFLVSPCILFQLFSCFAVPTMLKNVLVPQSLWSRFISCAGKNFPKPAKPARYLTTLNLHARIVFQKSRNTAHSDSCSALTQTPCVFGMPDACVCILHGSFSSSGGHNSVRF